MAANMQVFNLSGAGFQVTGSQTLSLALLCGVTNGSVIVPLALGSDGTLAGPSV